MKIVKLKGRTRLGGGAESECFIWRRGRVIKAYVTKKETLSAFKRQKKACAAGLATPVFEVVKIQDDRKRKYDKYEKGQCINKNWGYVCGRAQKTQREPTRALLDAAEALGFETHDLCARNIGKWEGRLVIVDFGDLTLLP